MNAKLFILILFFIFFVIIFPVFGQNRTGLTISPFLIEETVKPGQNFTKIITLTNNSDKEQIISIQLKDFQMKEDSKEIVFLPPGSEKTSLLYWLKIPAENIKLLPGESKKISFNFQIPEGLSAGSYYGAIIFSSQNPDIFPEQTIEEKRVQVGTIHQVGVFAFFRFLEGGVEEAAIKEFKTEKNYYYNIPFEIRFLSRIENLGNIYLKPSGLIKIQNIFGKEITSLSFNSENLMILPSASRLFENSWQGKFGFGKYTAILYLVFGTSIEEGGAGVKTVSTKTSFWILPWKIIILGIAILAFLILFGCLLWRRYKINRLRNL